MRAALYGASPMRAALYGASPMRAALCYNIG
jgi:hypothetical protein